MDISLIHAGLAAGAAMAAVPVILHLFSEATAQLRDLSRPPAHPGTAEAVPEDVEDQELAAPACQDGLDRTA